MNRGQKKRRRRSVEEIRQVVSEFERSGLSRVEFAASQGVSPSCLDNWRKKAREHTASAGKKPPRLVAVHLESPAGNTESLEVRVNDRWAVWVGPGFDEETLQRLLRMLAEC